MPWVDPVATVLEISRDGDDLCVSLELDRPYSPPLFPASLLRAEGDEALHLDRVEEVEPLRYEGRAFDAGHSSVAAGDRFIFRGWWTPDALDLVLDTGRSWVLARCPDDSDHEHCQLTWVTISAHGLSRPATGPEMTGSRSRRSSGTSGTINCASAAGRAGGAPSLAT